MITKGGGELCSQIGAGRACLFHQAYLVNQHEVCNTCRSAHGMGRVCLAVAIGAISISPRVLDLPHFFGDDGSGERCIG